MRSDYRSICCFCGDVILYPRLDGMRVWFWWCQVTLVSVAYVLMLASCHLIISSACCPQYIWLEYVLPIIPVDSGLLRVQLSLWSFACGLLWTWDSGCVRVLGSQVPLRPWNTGVTQLLLSWDSLVLRPWACYSAWKWCLLSGAWSCLVCSKPR